MLADKTAAIEALTARIELLAHPETALLPRVLKAIEALPESQRDLPPGILAKFLLATATLVGAGEFG